MTTIAWKDGVVAYDSRVAAGGTIQTDDFDKAYRDSKTGLIFVACGTSSGIVPMVEDYMAGRREPSTDYPCSALIIHPDGHISTFCRYKDEDYWTRAVLVGPLERCGAMGSGTDHALTAMDMGASAKEAVKMAVKRDTNTGGKIRTIRIPAKKRT